MTTTNANRCVSHQCGTCGRYVRADTVTEAPGYCASAWCPQHGRVDVLCGTRRPRSQT